MTERKIDLATGTGLQIEVDASDLAALRTEGGAWHDLTSAPETSGDRLRRELSVEGQPYDIDRLIDEAARLSDRLDGFDRLLGGDAELWLSISEVSGGLLEVRVDNVMGEARQTAAVLRQLIADIHKRQTNLGGAENEDDPTADL